MGGATVRDYSREMPTAAPDYLREWAEARNWTRNALIFSAGWFWDPLTGLKSRCSDVLCTACGKRFKAGWVSGYTCRGMGEGPRLQIGDSFLREGVETACPECGKRVTIRHKSGNGGCAWETAWPVTLLRIPEPGKADRLCLVLWRVTKEFDWDGRRSISIQPEQAYVVEERRMFRCNRAMQGMSGHVWYDKWHQVQRCTDEMRDIVEFCCPEGIAAATEGTTCENAKLELYLQNGATSFPAAYLWLYLKHRNAEALMTGGAAGILEGLIGQEKIDTNGSYRTTYSNRWPVLPVIDWKQKRPSAMLGLNREELRRAAEIQAEKPLGGGTWTLLLQLHREGLAGIEDAPEVEAFIENGDRYARDRLRYAVDRAGGFSRLAAYMKKQGGAKALGTLRDYWSMADHSGLNLEAPEIAFPRDLAREHDRLVEARNRAERERQAVLRQQQKQREQAQIEKRAPSFTKRFEKLSALAWERDGLLIFPPKDEAEMIAEGMKLNHCVATYARRHADGETAILFIRKAEAPQEPYFTLNWDERSGRIIQNRGIRNCDPPEEVKAFADAWAAWVRAGCPKDKQETNNEKERGAA